MDNSNFNLIIQMMGRIEIQQNVDSERVLTFDEMIISKSMNGWILQIFKQIFKRSN